MSGPERTTFSLDVIGRNICNTFDEATQNPEGIDVVVIGAGMYGGYCATELYNFSITNNTFRAKQRQPLRILLLEAGPFIALEHVQNLPDVGFGIPGIENVGSGTNPPVRENVWGQGWRSNTEYTGQAYCVGGKGIYWGGWCPRQDLKLDLSQWPADMVSYMTTARFPNPQLYSAQDQMTNGAYEYLEYQIGVLPAEDFVFDKSVVEKKDVEAGLNKVMHDFLKEKAKPLGVDTMIAPIAVSTRSDASGMFANNKFSSLPGLVSCVRRDRSFGGDYVRTAIVPNCHVRYLDSAVDAEGNQTKTIQTIRVIERGVEKELQISPHTQVILAGSAIESTRLALESFSLVSTGLLPPGQELMGNNLHTHHRFDFTFRFPKTYFDNYLAQKGAGEKLSQLLQVTALHVQGDRVPGKPAYQYQLFSASNTLSGNFGQNQSPDDLLYRLVPSLDLGRFIAEHQNSTLITVILRASGEMATNRSTRRGPNDNWVDLAGDIDYDQYNHHKRAWVQWGDHFGDEIWQTMYSKAVDISKLFGPDVEWWGPQGNWGKTLPGIDYIRYQQGLGTTYHDSGTLWMGEQPVTSINKGEKQEVSVLDSGGHFHHVTNAYNCDQASFPTVAVANPVPTGLVVARKVAADIFGRHSNLYNHYVPDDPKDKFVPLVTSQDQFNKEWTFIGSGSFDLQQEDLSTIGASSNFLINSQGSGQYGFFQYTKKKFQDVEFRVEWKSFRVSPGSPLPLAGILLRSNNTGPNIHAESVLIPINQAAKHVENGRTSYGDSLYKTGSVSGVAPATRWMAKTEAPHGFDGYWNEYKITIKQNQVVVALNNKVVCKTALPPTKNASGYLGFEINTGQVQFRNIRARDL